MRYSEPIKQNRTYSLQQHREARLVERRTVKQSSDASIKDLIPLLDKGGVDLYLAGHWHYYESLYPAKNGATGTGGDPVAKDFIDPTVTVHVTTGNGGPPGADSFHEDCPGPDCNKIPATRHQSVKFGYGRVTAFNATHLMYKQVIFAATRAAPTCDMTDANC